MSMIYLRTRITLSVIILSLLFSFSCNKDANYSPPPSQLLNNAQPVLVKDWTKLSLELASQSNGFNDLITSRALFYISVTMYEALLPGLEGYISLQARIPGFNTTLPQAEANLQYDWMIVANQALALVCSELYKSSGNTNLQKVITLRDSNISSASTGLSVEMINNSKHLGNLIGWKVIEYSLNDGRSDYYLQNFSDVKMPPKEGAWIPTPPDYDNKLVYPYWGDSKPAVISNMTQIKPYKLLEYSTSSNSIIWSEATEVYNFSTNLTEEQKDLINYWSDFENSNSSPLCHNMLLFCQFLDEKDITLDKAVELFVLLSITHYDGFILAWNTKFKYNLLRPSSYIKQHLNKYYIPEYSCMAVPEFASSKALIYTASSEVFAKFFGHRSPFTDLSQSHRTKLIKTKRTYSSFTEFAKEASYTDLYSATHFRSSIDVGAQMGYDISQLTLALKMKK